MENINKKLCSNKEPPTSHDETSSTSSAVSTANIFDLPQVPLLTTFDNIPLLNLLHIDEVCQDWAKLKKAALLRREQLVLVHDETDLEEYYNIPSFSSSYLRKVMNDDGSPYIKVRLDRHALYHFEITPMMVDRVIELMPNLKVLYIVQRYGSLTELWKIKLLLQYYRHQLEEVNIVFYTQEFTDADDLDLFCYDYRNLFLSIFSTLNTMTALTTLDLHFDLSDRLEVPIEIDLSVASRLKHLNVYTYGFNCGKPDDDLLKHTYEKYAEGNTALQSLWSDNRFFLSTLLGFGPRVTAAMWFLYIGDYINRERYENFKKLAQKYSHIEDLSFIISDLTIAQVAEALLPCKSLVNLSFDMSFDQKLAAWTPLQNDLPVKKLPVLPSVKSLCFPIFTSSHRDFEKLDLDTIFPNVQVIELIHDFDRCTECNFQVPVEFGEMIMEVQAAYSLRVHKCMRLFRSYFTRFAKLTTLKTNVGLNKISLSYKKEMQFTRETLDQETFFS